MTFLHQLFVLNWMKVGLLAQVSAHPIIGKVMNLAKSSVLRLQILGQRVPLHKRSIFPVHLSLEPLLPWLSRVHDWISQLFLLLFQEIRHLARFLIEYNTFKKLLIVDVSISILVSIFLIILRFFKSLLIFLLHSLEKHPSNIIIASENCVVNDSEANFSGMLNMSSSFNKAFRYLQSIPFDSYRQGSLSLWSGNIRVSPEGEEQIDDLQVSVK